MNCIAKKTITNFCVAVLFITLFFTIICVIGYVGATTYPKVFTFIMVCIILGMIGLISYSVAKDDCLRPDLPDGIRAVIRPIPTKL
jgi:hypothetical protein